MGDKFVFVMDMSDLKVKAEAFGPLLDKAITAVMASNAPRVQNYAREHAPWTDQTGNARQGLFAAYASPEQGKHEIELYHSVPYGIWLEIRNAGKYAIIQPTIKSEGERIMRDLVGIIGQL